MRYLAIILSIYIFVLNLAPCADYIPTNEAAKTEISQHTDDHQHQNSDLCSPFCMCQCCHINATYLQVTDLKFDVPYMSTQHCLHLNGIEKAFTASILQPPKA